jgi:peptide/nickel transport system ATP-binding protein
MIAMALSCRPSLLIADEPTTALDVTTQAQILELLRDLQADFGMAIMLITHDLGVAAQVADSMAVMYLGRVVEYGAAEQVLAAPRHPYTRALLRSMPRLGRVSRTRLTAIKGMVPPPYARPDGCAFHPRCDSVVAGKCEVVLPRRVPMADREVSCLLYEEEA